MEAYKGGKVYFHQFLTSTLIEMNGQFYNPAILHWRSALGAEWLGGGGGTAFGEAVNFLPLQRIEPKSSDAQSIAIHFLIPICM
jgi:hypothetical protein